MRPGLQAILTCCVVALGATIAHAGKVTRLQIELPPNIRAFEPGQRVDTVQVVGIDADGQRVGFDGATPELTATAGKVEVVEAPYRFAYTAPARIDGPLRLTLEARLPGSPSIKGSLQFEVLPPGPYVRLRVEALAERVDWDGSLEFQVRGETRDGRVVPVADRRIEIVADGPGTIAFTRLGHYRYRAPKRAPDKDGRATVTLRARVAEDAAVHGELVLALGSPFAGREPPATDVPEPPAEEGPGSSARPPAVPPEKPPQDPRPAPEDATGTTDTAGEKPLETPEAEETAEPATTEASKTKRPPKSVLWSGGRLRLTAWRVREADATDPATRRITKLPEPGGTFAAREPVQRLRFVVEDETVRQVTADARHGGPDGERASEAVDAKVKRNKAGKLTVVVEARPKGDGTELHVTLTLTRAEGEPSLDVLVLKRRKAKKQSAE